jgi:hypothetical protein
VSYRQQCAGRRARTRICHPTDSFILEGSKVRPARDLFRWARWYGTRKRFVKQTEVSPGFFVSTIFLGIDMGFGRPGPPVVFEWATMRRRSLDEREADERRYLAEAAEAERDGAPVFPFVERRYEVDPRGRCATYKQAIREHNKLVDAIRTTVPA